MSLKRHGLSIGIERTESGDKISQIFLTLKAVGTLSHDDYLTITPMLDAALEGIQSSCVKVLVDGTELDGWELRAAWDDFKLGLKHGRQFSKVAIFGNKNWQQMSAKIGSWFVEGEIKYFEDYRSAVVWLQESA